MIKIAFFTTTRAEFGVLLPLIKEVEKDVDTKPLLFVGGTHLAYEHGLTTDEIYKSGMKITDTFDYLLNETSSFSLAKSVGIAVIELSHIFRNFDFDFVCILGDRYELLAVVTNAILFKKPIIHLHGGENTEGAIDEQIRYMITKAAHIHFAACQEYKINILNTGEQKWRIFNTGALSVDNIINNPIIPKDKLFSDLKIEDRKTVLCTYHPVTLEYKISPLDQIKNLITAIDNFNFQVVFTAPNIDVDREIIINFLKEQVKTGRNFYFVKSLGILRYQSMIPHCEFVIGNSSSGIVEVPFFKIPTVNIGDRQKGRIRHKSIIDTDYSVESIRSGIKKAVSSEFKNDIKNMNYKFGDGTAAKKMVDIIRKIEIDERLMRK